MAARAPARARVASGRAVVGALFAACGGVLALTAVAPLALGQREKPPPEIARAKKVRHTHTRSRTHTHTRARSLSLSRARANIQMTHEPAR